MRGMASWAPVAFTLVLCSCSQVVHEQYYPPSAWGAGQSDRGLRVRIEGRASECTLATLARSHVVTSAVGGMVDERVRHDLVQRETQLATQEAIARSTGRDLALAMHEIEQQPQATTEADLLQVLNVICADLGAPQRYDTVADARAFLTATRVP